MKTTEYRIELKNEMGDWQELDCSNDLDEIEQMFRTQMQHYRHDELRIVKVVAMATVMKTYRGM